MRKKLAVMMAAMAATAMVGGCGAKDAAPTGAETKPAETSAAQETEAAQEETKEVDAHEAEYLAEFSMYRSKKIRTVLLFPLT